jgi:multidrug efflux pump subunit AcrB
LLSEFAVRRWQFTLVVFCALVALGGYALVTIPKAEDPSFPIPNIKVVAFLPGASPHDLERLVIDPVEARIGTLDDIKTMKSEAREGLATVFTEFHANVDPDEKHDEVLREVNALRSALPSQLARLDVLMYTAASVHVMEVALIGEEGSYRELDGAARRLKRRLESVSGVGGVQLVGLPRREVTVTLDQARLVAHGITAREIYEAISADSASPPAGSVEIGARRFNVATDGDYGSLDEIRATTVRVVEGRAVRVADVATVALADAEASHIARFDGKRAVIVAVAAKEDQDVFDVVAGVNTELTSFEASLPASLHIARGFDQSQNTAHRLGDFTRDFVLAIVIVLITLLPLGLRASVIVMVSIPLSLAIGLLLLKVTGFGINQLSIVGFVLALGLLVDDSVVVTENITRHLRDGTSPLAAAIGATKEITASVIGCTATLIFAFLPLLAMPGSSGQFIRSMPVALVFTVGASLLVSLTIVPFLAATLLKPTSSHGNALFRAMTWLVEGAYRPILGAAVGHPRSTLLLTVLLFAGSLALVPKVGFSLFPKAEIPQFLVKIETAEGASLTETDRATRFAEQALRAESAVTHVASIVGRGHPQIYYNVPTTWEKANTAEIFAQAAVRGEERSSLLERLRAQLAQFPGARIEVHEFANGPPIEAPIALRLVGNDEEALRAAAFEVEEALRSSAGARDVKNPLRERRTDLRVDIDRAKAGLLDVSVPTIDHAVRLAISGVRAGKYREDSADEPYDIRVTLPRAAAASMGGARPGLEVLDTLYVPNRRGESVPLAQLASLVFEPSSTTVRHHDKERCATVTAHVRDGHNVARVTEEVLAKLGSLKTRDVRLVVGGEQQSRKESFGGLGIAVIVAAFGLFGVLVLEFRTFKSTLIVASVIPLGVIGGVLALFLTGHTFSFIATVGFVALMGIEVKNSILLVDFTNQLRERGVPLDDAIQRAGETRFVPVLLTTLTAVGGLIPLILARSTLYSPLALVILGGLISSTLLTRVVTPVLYKLLAPEVAVPDREAAPAFAAQASALAE